MKANNRSASSRTDAPRGARASARRSMTSRIVGYAKKNPWKSAGLGALALGAGVGAYALLRRRGRNANAAADAGNPANPGNPGNAARTRRNRSPRNRAGS